MLDAVLCLSYVGDILEELLCLLSACAWRGSDGDHHRAGIFARHEFATGELHQQYHHYDAHEHDDTRGDLVANEELYPLAVGTKDTILVDGVEG